MNKYWRKISILIIVFIIAIGISSPYKKGNIENISIKSIVNKKNSVKQSFCKKIITNEDNINSLSHYDETSLVAFSALVYDATTETIIFGKNIQDVRPFASLAKILTVSTALSIIGGDSLISIPKDALHDYFEKFSIGERWKVRDLASYTLITSSNDAARALGLGTAYFFEKEFLKDTEINHIDSSEIFLGAMTQKASQYFMDNTVSYGIKSMSGLDTRDGKSSISGTVLEATQLALCAYEEYPNVISSTKFEEEEFISEDAHIYNAINTNTILKEIPNIVFSKTGYTILAGGNLIVGYRAPNNHLIVISVLGSTKKARFTDVLSLMQATIKTLEELEL